MPANTLSTRYERWGTLAEWASSTVVMEPGQRANETDTGRFKIGDGINVYAMLPYPAIFGGSAGPEGPAGPAGPQGIQGIQGPAGPQGLQGLQGIPGTPGAPGADGLDGADGAQGLQGLQGPQGLPGTNGTNGLDGADGATGATGNTGPQGIQGVQGAQGIQGPAGTPGPTDHGLLTGLADDDHTQYHNNARGDARYALIGHTHGGSGWTVIRKTSDTARTANTTLTADPVLTASLGVGLWTVRLTAFFTTANATMDYKYSTSMTGTATVLASYRKHVAAGAASASTAEIGFMSQAQLASTAVAATTTGAAVVQIELIINVTVAGVWSFLWAQNTSDAGALTCLRGSYLEYIGG